MKLVEFEEKENLIIESEYISNILTEEFLSSVEFMNMNPEERKKYIQQRVKEYVDSRGI